MHACTHKHDTYKHAQTNTYKYTNMNTHAHTNTHVCTHTYNIYTHILMYLMVFEQAKFERKIIARVSTFDNCIAYT